MISRFEDKEHGKRRLLDCLLEQTLVNKENSFAEKLVDKVKLRELRSGETLIEQDGNDSDLYFIITGSFSIRIHQREVAVRSHGSYVGEMALLDPAVNRSATVVARETSVVAAIDEGSFSELANQFPVAWRKISSELCRRLRERSKFLKPPNAKPMIFIGSSAENLAIAKKIKNALLDSSVEVKVWSEPGIFELSQSSLSSLLQTAQAYDFAIMIFDENDILESRNKHFFAPRDNVIFELGMFFGTLGAERSYIIRPKSLDLKIPSDLLGITMLTWEADNIEVSLQEQCVLIKELIKKLGPK